MNTPQPPPITSPPARPPLSSPLTLPQQPLPTVPRLSTGGVTLDSRHRRWSWRSNRHRSQQNRPAQLPLSRPAVTGDARGGAGAEKFGTRVDTRAAAGALPLPRTASPTPAESWQPRLEASGECCVCFKALVAPMVNLGSCLHQLHLPCYTAFRVRAAANLRCPTCRATATVEEADRRALRQHSERVMVWRRR